MGKNDLIKNEGFFSNLFGGILKRPGDKFSGEARITSTNRQVVKMESQNEEGNAKYSVTRYPSGTTVETRTMKPKKNK